VNHAVTLLHQPLDERAQAEFLGVGLRQTRLLSQASLRGVRSTPKQSPCVAEIASLRSQ